MGGNFFTQNPQVMEFILKHEGERHQIEQEVSVTGALAAILNDSLADEEESGLTGKSYTEGEVPITSEEAEEVIREMRRAVFGTVEQVAQGVATELGLEIDLFSQDDFNTQYALVKQIGDKRFGSECKHLHTLNGHCVNCFRPVVTL